MSWWRYRGQCTGRVLHFLYHYVGFDAAEYARVGDGVVTLRDRPIATFGWSGRFGERDVPEFVFVGEDAPRCEENQRTKREAAILEALPNPPALERRQHIDEAVLHALILDDVRSVRLHTQIVDRADPDFFVARNSEGEAVLWCKAGRAFYYWSRAIGEWLRGPKDEEASS